VECGAGSRNEWVSFLISGSEYGMLNTSTLKHQLKEQKLLNNEGEV
jgi:hypothetical protein